MYFIDGFKDIKLLFVRINSNKLKTKFFFYCFLSLYFMVNISIIITKFFNFYCKLVIMKMNSVALLSFEFWVCISSPSNVSFIDFDTDCSLVLITSCKLNPKFILRLHDLFVLQPIITFNAKSLRKNLLFGCLFGWSTNSYPCFFFNLVHICLWWLVNIYDLVYRLYAFHSTIMYHYHLLLLLYHCFHMF